MHLDVPGVRGGVWGGLGMADALRSPPAARLTHFPEGLTQLLHVVLRYLSGHVAEDNLLQPRARHWSWGESQPQLPAGRGGQGGTLWSKATSGSPPPP